MNTRSLLQALAAGALVSACTSADEVTVDDEQPVASDAESMAETGAQDHLAITAAMLDFAPARPDAAMLPKPLGTLLATWGGRPPKSCVRAASWPDRDHDGIPARWHADFDCRVFRPNGLTVRIQGGVSIADTDDAVAMSGYSMAFQKLQVGVFLNRAPVISRTLDGNVSVEAIGPARYPLARLALEQDLQLYVDRWFALRRESTIYEGKLSGAYTADRDIAFEAPLSSGSLELEQNGVLIARRHRTAIHGMTVPTLHYDAACQDGAVDALPFDAGTYVVEAGGSVVRVHFRGCGEWTVGGTLQIDARALPPAPQVAAQPAPQPTHTGDPPDLPPPNQ